MKFSCSKQKLNEAVLNVQRAVSQKSTMPALEGILIRTINGKLILTGYDLEIGITTSIDAMIYEDGGVVASARLFSEIIRRMPEEQIEIETDSKLTIYITSGKSDYKIIGLPDKDFPELPSVTAGESMTIKGDTLKSMIRQTIYAISDKDTLLLSNPVLNLSKFFTGKTIDNIKADIALHDGDKITLGDSVFTVIIPGALLIGAGIGYLGSRITIKKHLKV